jgi:hypothetical protein
LVDLLLFAFVFGRTLRGLGGDLRLNLGDAQSLGHGGPWNDGVKVTKLAIDMDQPLCLTSMTMPFGNVDLLPLFL